MSRDNRQVRKIRRIKRERSVAYKMADVALAQRDQARMVAYALEQELKRRDEAQLPKEPKLTITKIEEDEQVEQDNPTN